MKKSLLLITFLSLICTICQAQTTQQADSLHQRGRELLDEGKIIEGRECTRMAMEIRKKLLGEVSEDYITSLNNYANSFYLEKDFPRALELQKQVKTLCEKLNQPHKNIGLFATNLGRCYYFCGAREQAVKEWERALPLVEKFSENYEYILNALSVVYEELRDIQGMSRIMALMEEHNQHELTKPCDEPKCMLERAQYYYSTGQNDEAKACYLKALDMPMDDETKIKAHEEYGKFLAIVVNDRTSGAEHQLAAANIRKSLHGEDSDYANAMYSAGLYYYFSQQKQDYEKAIECYEKARKVFHESSSLLKMEADCWEGIGDCCNALEDYKRAQKCFIEAIRYYESHDQINPKYPKMILSLANTEKYIKDYDASIDHYKQAMQLFEERDMIEEYANAANSLKLCYAYAHRENDVVDMEETMKKIQRKKLGDLIQTEKDNLELTRQFLGKLIYAETLGNIAGSYSMLEENDSAIHYFKQYIPTLREAIRDEFRLQSEAERMATWERGKMTIYNLQDMYETVSLADDVQQGEWSALAYDVALLSKGILLNSSIEFEKVLAAQEDGRYKRIYEQSLANDAEIKRLRGSASNDADLEKIVQMTQETQALQRDLYRGCSEYADFTDYISYDWHDVKAQLQPKDVAIEFLTLSSDIGIHETMVALVLTPQMEHPKAVCLWTDSTLISCLKTPYMKMFQDSIIQRSTSIIFNPESKVDSNYIRKLYGLLDEETPNRSFIGLYLNDLMNRVDSMANMAFTTELFDMSISHLLEQLSVPEAGEIIWGALSEELQGRNRIFFSADGDLNRIAIEYLLYQGKPLSEQFEVYRLSSTKELCFKRDRSKPTKAALFGDINYNDEATKNVTTQHALASLRGSREVGNFADLSNTLREVNEIQSILRDKGLKVVERFRDTEASKSAFLGMTDTNVNLLHIATHGMYKEDKESTDDVSMRNSLLAFSGANLDNNALVTAADIASMNLRQCDLAVLSACETGLGKLGGDGVFGLQRGFKNAGVHTLLMSLKSVYDESTADLMICFYKHLMNGSSKREALVKAQKDIRDKGFNDPKYWATFILLDAF